MKKTPYEIFVTIVTWMIMLSPIAGAVDHFIQTNKIENLENTLADIGEFRFSKIKCGYGGLNKSTIKELPQVETHLIPGTDSPLFIRFTNVDMEKHAMFEIECYAQ